eukprot:TRINITY_DN12183_c0_g1_i1.p1 TRINITY_DN12183_c0_g1~~TRINITY_DN12183_c0_g1_i1.p1  ORF type:complete len:356 (+),score=41.17 TRINITY_DN12183_c0_g1_i1:112-1068(+)
MTHVTSSRKSTIESGKGATLHTCLLLASYVGTGLIIFLPNRVGDAIVQAPPHWGLGARDLIKICLLHPLCMVSSFLHLLFLHRSCTRAQKHRQNSGAPEAWPLSTFAVLLALSVVIASEGAGMHVATNALHSIVNPGNEYRPHAPHLERVLYFMDEILGHRVWFFGLALMWSVLLFAERSARACMRAQLCTHGKGRSVCASVWLHLFALLHGFGWFAAGVEGQTLEVITIPFSLFAIAFAACCPAGSDRSKTFKERAEESSFFPHVPPLAYALGVSGVVCIVLSGLWCYFYGYPPPEFRVLGLGHFHSWPKQLLQMLM